MREARARHEIAARLAAAASASDNVTWQSELVSAHEGIAYILNSQNDILGALREFSAGFAIAERLARENPDNAVLQRNLSLSYSISLGSRP